MDERLKYITDNFDNLHIGLDDTFRFHCDQCGKCCIDREDILLNPKDVFNIYSKSRLYAEDFSTEFRAAKKS